MSVDEHPPASARGYPWTLMDISGHPWVSMSVHGRPLASVGLHGQALVDIRGHPWTSMGVRGHPWASVGIHGRPWAPVDTRGHPWTSMRIYGRRWASMGVRGHAHRTSPDSVHQTGDYTILLNPSWIELLFSTCLVLTCHSSCFFYSRPFHDDGSTFKLSFTEHYTPFAPRGRCGGRPLHPLAKFYANKFGPSCAEKKYILYHHVCAVCVGK